MVPLRAIETASLLLRLTLLVAALTVALGLIDGRAALAEAQAVRGVEETRAHCFAAYREVAHPLAIPDQGPDAAD